MYKRQLRTGAFVTDLDLGRKSVSLLDGTEIAYDKLLLATGSRPRRLPLADDSGVPTAYPVSYTHLDVYKRQASYSASELSAKRCPPPG